MNKNFKKVTSMFLAAMLAATPAIQSMGSFVSNAEKTRRIDDKVLFQTSFESGENDNLLSSTLDDGYLSNVIKTQSPTGGGKGLPVLYETIRGSDDYLGSECKYNLFDGKTSSKFLSSGSKIYVSFALEEEAIIRSYSIASANDEQSRDPSAWTLYGSKDGEEWVILDARKNIVFSGRQQTKSFGFTNEESYKWYKLDITANRGGSLTQFSNLDLFTEAIEDDGGSTTPDIDTSVKITHDLIESVDGTMDYGPGEDKKTLFDGKTSTKWIATGGFDVWLSMKLKKATVINGYEISVCNDQHKRDPKSWNFYGSNDGKTWTLLDSRENEKFAEFYQTNTYTFENTTAYTYYKIGDMCYNSQDDFGLDITHMSEFKLLVADKAKTGGSSSSALANTEEESVVAEVDMATIDGSKDNGGGEAKKSAFDGNVSTKVCAPGSTFYVTFALKKSEVIKGYSLTSANDHLTRTPKSWVLYGSTDGKTWVKLDSQTNAQYADYYEEQVFAIDNTKSYQYYKFDVLENGGNTYTQFSELKLFTKLAQGAVPEEVPGMDSVAGFGPISTECNTPGAWTGYSCLAVYGQQTSTEHTYARNVLYKDLSIPVTANTRLSYVIFPGLFNIHAYDYEYTSCRVVIDLKFTDGTYLSQLGAKDQYGSLMTPEGQVKGECLYTAQWNYVESCIGDVAAGKTIEKICVYFDMKDSVDASKFVTYFDDLKIEDKEEVVYDHLSDYINILRGTNNDIAFSRGMCTPGVTLPGGFNFFTPVTNADSATLPYTYQQSGAGNPLDSISIIHAPNFWIGSYGSFQFMANTSVNTAGGTGDVKSADISSKNREAGFSHINESAKAHLYSVTLNEGSAASGVTIEVTATMHGAYVRFIFPENSENVNVIFDSLWGGGTFKFADDKKTFTAKTGHGSPAMYVYGQFDSEWTSATKVGSKQGIAAFPKGTKVVTMKLATSFISSDQAKHNLELEIGAKDTFDTILAAAQKTWDDLCGIFEIEGASYHELVSFYSSLYRMYAYPNLFSENEGTNESPKWVYGSPYKDGKKVSGIMYTNNGFWDTYRTAWSGYALFTPERDGEYLNGMVQHYIETGWMPRWLGPAAVNCMVGTSSDIIFADAYLKGIDFNYAIAWQSMIKSASAYSSNMTSGGRKENNTAPYYGYIANNHPTTGNQVNEAYSSSIEGYINDYGIYRMAEALGFTDEAAYYKNRCENYALLFHAAADFFMGKSTTGVWSSNAKSFNPAQWNGDRYDFTESVGWVNAFPAVFDGQGMVNLYGGPEALAKKLDQLFDDSYEAMKKVPELASVHHEISEFKEVKMGQYMHNNQPAHHVIYTYAYSSTPYKVQEYVREVLRHVYVGSEIGQGYPGDEDNGEMSGWYIFNALGFYPYNVGSGEYIIGSPLFDKVTIHLENGNDVVIKAQNNSDENIYIQSCKINGKDYNSMFLTHKQLTEGCEIEFVMGATPSTWGNGEKPTSLTTGTTTKPGVADISVLKNINTDVAEAAKLFDNDSLTGTAISDGTSFVFDATAAKVSLVTMTSSVREKAPKGMKLEVSNDGTEWKSVAEKNGLVFSFDNFIVPVQVAEENQGNYRFYKLTLFGGSELSEIEFLGEKGDASKLDDPFAEKDPIVEPGTTGDPGNSGNSGEGTTDNNPSDNPSQSTPSDDAKKESSSGIIGWIAAAVAIAAVAIGGFIFFKKKSKK